MGTGTGTGRGGLKGGPRMGGTGIGGEGGSGGVDEASWMQACLFLRLWCRRLVVYFPPLPAYFENARLKSVKIVLFLSSVLPSLGRAN